MNAKEVLPWTIPALAEQHIRLTGASACSRPQNRTTAGKNILRLFIPFTSVSRGVGQRSPLAHPVQRQFLMTSGR
jgi:hypothetical protein